MKLSERIGYIFGFGMMSGIAVGGTVISVFQDQPIWVFSFFVLMLVFLGIAMYQLEQVNKGNFEDDSTKKEKDPQGQ